MEDTVIGNWIVDRLLGQGGMGKVYLARHRHLNTLAALKVLNPSLTHDESFRSRFLQEAQTQSQLEHPNIARVIDYIEHEGQYYLVAEYVPGGTLADVIHNSGAPIDVMRALAWTKQALSALDYAHQRGVIHRDVKPSNIMFDAAGNVKVLDFGVALVMGGRRLTSAGVTLGTPEYMSPEQITQPLNVDHRTDVYSTGIVLYEMLTGRAPFHGDTDFAVKAAQVSEPPPPLGQINPAIPPAVEQVVMRAIAKDPNQRYSGCGEFIVALDRLFAPAPSVNPDPRPAPYPGPVPPPAAGPSFRLTAPAKVVIAAAVLFVIGVAALFFEGDNLRQLFGGQSVRGDNANRLDKPKPGGSGTTGDVILRLHGSNTLGSKLVPALAEEFLKRQGATGVRTLPGTDSDEFEVRGTLPGDSTPQVIEVKAHGSATAFTDMAQGACDIGLASRRVNPSEVQTLSSLGDMTSPACEHIVGLDGIAIIVNPQNPIQDLTRDQLAQIFSGEITKWSQVLSPRGNINIYARDDKSGTYDSFKTMVLNGRALSGNARRFEDSTKLSDAVAADPDGIGFIALPYILNAKAVSVSDVGATPLLPTRATVASEDYLLSRRLFLYTPPVSQNPAVRKFIDFAISKAGQDMVEQNGFVAQNVKVEKGTTVAGAPAEYKALTAGAERLSLNFRFRPGGSDLDNKALVDLGRVIDFTTDMKYTGQNILLLGFADNVGNPAANVALSTQRAKAVADQFKRRGMNPETVSGFGSELPVASNNTEDGREKNRRVEIWVKK
jgi:phosphate transport system substrate-binding protein